MTKRTSLQRSLAPLVLGFCVLLLWPAESFGRAVVRFIHGVPGAGTATIKLNAGGGDVAAGSIGFGQVTPWRSIRSGSFRWSLVGGGKTLAHGTSTLGNGAYDIVVLAKGAGVALGIYKAEGGKRGTSLVRVIHGAPELGSPELTLDSKTVVKSLGFTRATPYLSVKPGMHSLGAMRPGDSTPLVSGGGVKLTPDVAYSAVVLGSRGQRVRVVTVVDRGAPLTRAAGHSGAASSQPAKPKSPKSKASKSTSAKSNPPRSVVVHSGDSLWAIARRISGAQASNVAVYHELVAIWNLNAERIGTGDPNLIFPGQRLLLPS